MVDNFGAVVVALPRDDDPVWRYSSEKKPHLTILFLGQDIPGSHAAHMLTFLEHVVNTEGRRFSLDVDHRGPLGDDEADVLFFDEEAYSFKESDLHAIRNNLLKDPVFAKAYLSVEQFPKWTPHLTMGYPDTPAKKDDRDYPGITWVSFDRIALWLTDFDGPEFLLPIRHLDPLIHSDTKGGARVDVNQFLATEGVTLRHFAPHEFDESKVKRDGEGQFAKKASDEIAPEDIEWLTPEQLDALGIDMLIDALDDVKKYVRQYTKDHPEYASSTQTPPEMAQGMVDVINKHADKTFRNVSPSGKKIMHLKYNKDLTSFKHIILPNPNYAAYKKHLATVQAKTKAADAVQAKAAAKVQRKFDKAVKSLPEHKSGPMFNPQATIDTSRISDASDSSSSESFAEWLKSLVDVKHSDMKDKFLAHHGISQEKSDNLGLVEAFLAHHGILGQKWGVRRENPSGGGTYLRPFRTAAVNVKNVSVNVRDSPGDHTKSLLKGTALNALGPFGSSLVAPLAVRYSSVAPKIQRGSLELNKKYSQPGKNLSTNRKLQDAYDKEYQKMIKDAFSGKQSSSARVVGIPSLSSKIAVKRIGNLDNLTYDFYMNQGPKKDKAYLTVTTGKGKSEKFRLGSFQVNPTILQGLKHDDEEDVNWAFEANLHRDGHGYITGVAIPFLESDVLKHAEIMHFLDGKFDESKVHRDQDGQFAFKSAPLFSDELGDFVKKFMLKYISEHMQGLDMSPATLEEQFNEALKEFPEHKSGPMFNPDATIDTSRIHDANDHGLSRARASSINESMGHSFEDVEAFLAHHGILGQRWGIRRERGSDGTVGGNKKYRTPRGQSEDGARAARTARAISKHGPKAASLEDLQHLRSWLQAEQGLRDIQAQKTGRIHSNIRRMLKYGGTLNDAIKYSNSPAGLLMHQLLTGMNKGPNGRPMHLFDPDPNDKRVKDQAEKQAKKNKKKGHPSEPSTPSTIGYLVSDPSAKVSADNSNVVYVVTDLPNK